MSAQSAVALARANDTRMRRYAIRGKIKSGELTVAEVLADPPPCLDRMPIEELLRAQQRWGRQRSTRLLFDVDINPVRPVGKLTVRQRALISGALAANERRRREDAKRRKR